MTRPAALQHVLDATRAALAPRVADHPAAAAHCGAAFASLDARCGTVTPQSGAARPPVVDEWLEPALATARAAGGAQGVLADALSALAPALTWAPRNAPVADPAFAAGHANAWVTGAGALEDRSDVIVGISLVAPGLTYPVHRHPEEEVYTVLCDGAWWRDGTDWWQPGMGGMVHNPPGVRHAMRASASSPLLAVWILTAAPQTADA